MVLLPEPFSSELEKKKTSAKICRISSGNELPSFHKLAFYSCFYVLRVNGVSICLFQNHVHRYSLKLPANILKQTLLNETTMINITFLVHDCLAVGFSVELKLQ